MNRRNVGKASDKTAPDILIDALCKRKKEKRRDDRTIFEMSPEREELEYLVWFLNDQAGHAAELHRLLSEHQKLSSELLGPKGWNLSWRANPSDTVYLRHKEILKQVNSLLQLYSTAPVVSWSCVEDQICVQSTWLEKPQEHIALSCLLRLACEKRLDKVQICPFCTRWHIKLRTKQTLCKKCRKEQYEKSPRGLKTRKDYKRTNRKGHKDRVYAPYSEKDRRPRA